MSGLRVPSAVGLGVAAHRAVEVEWDTLESAQAWLNGKGVSLAIKIPVMPEPTVTHVLLTGTDSAAYTEMYVGLNHWWGFYAEVLASVKVDLLQYENMIQVLEAQTRNQLREENNAKAKTERMTAVEIADRVLLDPTIRPIRIEAQRAQQKATLIQAKLETVERNLKLVSRQVEIRRLDQEQSHTGANMPGRNLRVPG